MISFALKLKSRWLLVTNKEFAEKLNIKLTGNTNLDNQKIDECLIDTVPEKFVKYVKINGKYKKFTLSPISFHIGFSEQIWSQLSLAEKLKVMKWASEDYLQLRGYGTDFPPFVYFCDNDLSSISFDAISLNGKILLSLNRVDKMSGYEAYSIAIHESIHELDFATAETILNNTLCDYIYRYEGLHNFRNLRQLMELPIQGKIINWKTGKYDFVTEELKEKILLCKNSVMTISKSRNTPSCRKYIYSPAEFDRYLRSDFYYVSPFESKAYNTSIQHILSMAEYNNESLNLTDNDKNTLETYRKFLLKVNGRKREIQKYFKMPASHAVNIEMEYMFNRHFYGNRTQHYICKKHMQKREEAVKFFWDMKHAGKGDYVPEGQRRFDGGRV